VKFALAAAITFALLNAICAVAAIISPDGTIAVFNDWFHGLDLKLLVPPGGKAGHCWAGYLQGDQRWDRQLCRRCTSCRLLQPI
jgi:hypothetical protein